MGTNEKTATKAVKKIKKSKVTKAKKAAIPNVAFNVSVPQKFLKKIDIAARKAKLPRSAYVRRELEARL